ncbi:jg17623 [Pararge aegeria aegeria]|uniref:Jg17623 protein n=1 Tax=Pararge aegeria aegeria TaxID=348720 RepID=A0A8S4R5K3_9NEOP|nr:jg17623 [Pararge aegeria aegeria]
MVVGYEETFTISQLSPKSAANEEQYPDVLLKTSNVEKLAFNLEPSAKYDDIEMKPQDLLTDEESEYHLIVERSVEPNRGTRSINTDEIQTSNNNEIDNELDVHKRKYNEIIPTKTLSYIRDEEAMMMSSGFGDKLEFRFPGEGKRAPKGRALAPPGPKFRPTVVQPPTFATVNYNQGRQNTEIQNIITGIVKLLNGNVNVQANTQLLNGRPRPMASRINNRGPPRISDVPSIPDFDKPITPPTHSYHPTKIPPPYPFDRPPGVNLQDQIGPPMSSRPGFHRPMPPWQRRPRPPPNRRPNPGLPVYKPTLIPPPEISDDKQDEFTFNENESHIENNIHDHHGDILTFITTETSTELKNITDDIEKENQVTTIPETSTTTKTTTSTSTTTTTETTTSTSTTTEKPTEKPKPTQPTTQKTTTENPKTEKPVKPDKEKKKDQFNLDKDKLKDKYKTDDKSTERPVINETVVNVENNMQPILEPSVVETPTSTMVSTASPTPTDGLISHAPPSSESSIVHIDIKTSSINTQPLPTSPHSTLGPSLGTGVAIPADDLPLPPPQRQPTPRPLPRPHSHAGQRPHTYRRPQPTVRIDTCIVGDDSTCDQAQNEKCRTEAGISSCQCRPGYARRVHRDPCRRVVSLIMNLRVDKIYDRKIDSAFSMTPFSDDFVSGSVNSIHKGDEDHKGVYVNYTVLMQETPETLRAAVATDIQKHILGVIRRRSNNIGASALWVDSPAGSVLPLVDLDECSNSELNDCHTLAICTNTWGAFRCVCPDTTLDTATVAHRSGRDCRACAASHCSERGVCRYANGQPYCTCSSGYYGSTCEMDGEVIGVAVGASLAAALVIALTLAALLSWSRKWSREQKAVGMGSPVFNYMAANTIKTPPVGQPPYQVTLEERMRWAQIAEAMVQANHYAQADHTATMATRPSSAMFGGYPTLPPVPLPRMGMHGHHTGTLNTVTSRANTAASHHNMYGYTNHMAPESTSSEASSHVQERADLLVPRPKSRARSMHNQNNIYYDVDYENAPEPIYGSKGIPLSTYTISRGPPFYRHS